MRGFRSNLRVVGQLGRRSVRQTFRRPQLAAPLVVFPTILLAIQTAGAGRAVDLPQFPEVNGFLDFMLAGAMMQACMLAGNTGAIALALDIEMGFDDRLLAAPVSRYSLLLGRLMGTAVMGLLIAAWFIVIGLIFGVQFQAGILGVAWIFGCVATTAVAFGAIAASIALRSGKASVVQGLFPLIFVVLFLSTAFFPDNLMLQPAASIAKYNPLSFVVDGMREPIVSGFSGSHTLRALASIAGLLMIGFTLSTFALRSRLRRG
ncbi:MAG: ABC transporter permease [Solirubrobacterales bacterium]